MKLIFRKNDGKCHICGRPTRLFIHKPCGLASDEAKRNKKVGIGGVNQQHAETSKHNRNKKKWAAGVVLPWMK